MRGPVNRRKFTLCQILRLTAGHSEPTLPPNGGVRKMVHRQGESGDTNLAFVSPDFPGVGERRDHG